ncbi:hypothetical protein CQZ76_02050 [Anaplasma marginale]|nr:hypothetical protein CQZ76_02050 [Anaplasma marginale]
MYEVCVMDESLQRSREGWGPFMVDPARATVAKACKEMRDRSMSSFAGAGQFIITMSALIAAVIAICGACLQPAVAGSALSWSCLAFVLLLLLVVATGVIVAANNIADIATGSDVRIVRPSRKGCRELSDDGGRSKAMVALACISALALIGVIVACICIDVNRGGWCGGFMLAALVLFTIAAFFGTELSRGYTGYTVVEYGPDEAYHITVNAVPASDGQEASRGSNEDSGQVKTADVPPDTFVVTVGLDSPDSLATLGNFVVLGFSPQLQCRVYTEA